MGKYIVPVPIFPINLSPKSCEVSLSEALQKDGELLNVLVGIIRDNPGIDISPYCFTKKFHSLLEFLAQQNLVFSVTQKPIGENSHHLVSYLDSKVGSRTKVEKIKHASVVVPNSIVCGKVQEVLDAVQWFYSIGKSCVVKANFGESGWGLILVTRDRLATVDDAVSHVLEKLNSDDIWSGDLILVEEYIESDASVGGTSPSSELYLDESGPKITYVCDQVIGANADFLGVALGLGVLSKKIKKQIRTASLEVGKCFWGMGYRGFFDIDFVVTKKGIPVVIETNMRRTGGTHVFDAVRSLMGKRWESTIFALSQDSFMYGQEVLSEDELLGRMRNILYPIGNCDRGVIISIINKKRPTFGFIIIEKTKQDAVKLYDDMRACFR